MLEDYPRNIPVKLFQNLSTDLAEVFLRFFLYIALVAILFNDAERFEQFLDSHLRNIPV